jgi:hypothetical protein
MYSIICLVYNKNPEPVMSHDDLDVMRQFEFDAAVQYCKNNLLLQKFPCILVDLEDGQGVFVYPNK